MPLLRWLGRVFSAEADCQNLVRDIERCAVRGGVRRVKVKIRDDLLNWFLNEDKHLLNYVKAKHGIDVEFETLNIRVSDLKEASYEVQGL